MKKSILFILLASFSMMSYSQGEAALPQGGKQLNFGLPGYVGLDFALHDMVTLGPKVVYELFSNNNTFKAGVVADFHFNTIFGLSSDWDVYAGASAGWRFKTDNDKGNEGFDIGGQIGGRWFWSEKWGVNVEAGFSGSVGGGVGLTMRM